MTRADAFVRVVIGALRCNPRRLKRCEKCDIGDALKRFRSGEVLPLAFGVMNPKDAIAAASDAQDFFEKFCRACGRGE